MEQQIVGDFIDATVNNHEQARGLLARYPQLKEATWFGDDPVLTFLVIEDFVRGVEFCLEHGFDPDRPHPRDGDPPLIYACYLNLTEIAETLLRHNANPNATSLCHDCPLHCCTHNGNAELVDALIASGANPNYTTNIGETIFDNWPNDAGKQRSLTEVLKRHDVTPQAK